MLFILCAAFFILSSIRSGDMLALSGSLIFLIACGFFLVPLVRAMRRAKNLAAGNKRQ
jgi:hypothetical protein